VGPVHNPGKRHAQSVMPRTRQGKRRGSNGAAGRRGRGGKKSTTINASAKTYILFALLLVRLVLLGLVLRLLVARPARAHSGPRFLPRLEQRRRFARTRTARAAVADVGRDELVIRPHPFELGRKSPSAAARVLVLGRRPVIAAPMRKTRGAPRHPGQAIPVDQVSAGATYFIKTQLF
jgi:hypothetical protein